MALGPVKIPTQPCAAVAGEDDVWRLREGLSAPHRGERAKIEERVAAGSDDANAMDGAVAVDRNLEGRAQRRVVEPVGRAGAKACDVAVDELGVDASTHVGEEGREGRRRGVERGLISNPHLGRVVLDGGAKLRPLSLAASPS